MSGMHFGYQFVAERVIASGPEIEYVSTENRGKNPVILVGFGDVDVYVVQMGKVAVDEKQGGPLAEYWASLPPMPYAVCGLRNRSKGIPISLATLGCKRVMSAPVSNNSCIG